MTIRPVLQQDHPGLAALEERARERAGSRLPLGAAGERWRVGLSDRTGENLVFVTGSKVLGFVSYGSAKGAAVPGADIELRALCVEPAHWRAGIGRALWAAAARGMRVRHARIAVAWVSLEDIRARYFLEAVGFALVPNETRESNGWRERQILYRFDVVAAPAAAV